MGHLIETWEYDYGKTTKEIEKNKQIIDFETNEFAEHESDSHGGLYNSLHFFENKRFEDREDAESWLDQQTRERDYFQGACLYKNYTKVNNSKSERLQKKVKSLNEKYDAMYKAMKEYVEKNNVKNRKSIYVGCSKCGSKLHKDYIKLLSYSQPCPLCGNDLFSDTVKARIQKYRDDLSDIEKEIEKVRKDVELAAKSGKFTWKWLVRIEVHC